MEIFTISKRDKKTVFDMASGHRKIDYNLLRVIQRRISNVFIESQQMAVDYPENVTVVENAKQMRTLKEITTHLLQYHCRDFQLFLEREREEFQKAGSCP